MAITAAVCNSFKTELLAMTPHTAADVYKIALYTSAATLSKSTTAYSATNEVGNSGTYAAGGLTLVGFTASLDTDTAILDWTTDPVWTGATITARGALIYNSVLAAAVASQPTAQSGRACTVAELQRRSRATPRLRGDRANASPLPAPDGGSIPRHRQRRCGRELPV